MNVEIGAEAAQFPAKEYINGIAVAVYVQSLHQLTRFVTESHSLCNPLGLATGVEEKSSGQTMG